MKQKHWCCCSDFLTGDMTVIAIAFVWKTWSNRPVCFWMVGCDTLCWKHTVLDKMTALM